MRTILLAASLALTAAAASAETSTPYQPMSQSRSHTGYAETQIDANRLHVTFRGASGASRESVEASLLYRAAELTLARGFDYFVVVGHTVDADVEVSRVGPPLPPIAPRRYHTDAQFVATSDLLLFKGVAPFNAPNAFDARTVQSNLSARIGRAR